MEAFRIEEVTLAVRDAMARGALSFDAVKHLLLCRIERRPPRLDMTIYPYLPKAVVATTSAKAYLGLLTGVASSEMSAFNRMRAFNILDAITYLLSGRTYVPRSPVEAGDDEASVSQGDRGAAPILSTEADLSKLTKRQREVLQLLARGMSNKEIARALKIAEATTKIHMAALLRALRRSPVR